MEILLNPIGKARIYELNVEKRKMLSHMTFVTFNDDLIRSKKIFTMLDQTAIYYTSDNAYALVMTGQDFVNYYDYVQMSIFEDKNYSAIAFIYKQMLEDHHIDRFRPITRKFIEPDFQTQKIISFVLGESGLKLDALFNLKDADQNGAEPTIMWGLKLMTKRGPISSGMYGVAHFIKEKAGGKASI